jgi:uncharacterized protein
MLVLPAQTATEQKAGEDVRTATMLLLNLLIAILTILVSKQVQDGIDFFARKYDSMKFLAYFQAYTNTYAPFGDLKRLYEEALQHPKIIGLVVSTRPDCVNGEILDYLTELSKKVYVMVEFGLESHLDKTLGNG